jgi:ketosteroid isomerase-like protein
MSENLDLVRSIYADWERGDFGSAEWADPNIDFAIIGGPTRYEATHGIPGMARSTREFLTEWEGYRVEAEEYRELDEERILVLTLDTARGRTSGVHTVAKRAHVLHLHGGKVVSAALYWDRDRAFADLGLEG